MTRKRSLLDVMRPMAGKRSACWKAPSRWEALELYTPIWKRASLPPLGRAPPSHHGLQCILLAVAPRFGSTLGSLLLAAHPFRIMAYSASASPCNPSAEGLERWDAIRLRALKVGGAVCPRALDDRGAIRPRALKDGGAIRRTQSRTQA